MFKLLILWRDSIKFFWKAVEQYFTVKFLIFLFYSVCNVGRFLNLGLGTVRSERIKHQRRKDSSNAIIQ